MKNADTKFPVGHPASGKDADGKEHKKPVKK